ncbi:MAG: hypothetical protein ACOYU2_13540 [Nitrospirota bacterium]
MDKDKTKINSNKFLMLKRRLSFLIREEGQDEGGGFEGRGRVL